MSPTVDFCIFLRLENVLTLLEDIRKWSHSIGAKWVPLVQLTSWRDREFELKRFFLILKSKGSQLNGNLQVSKFVPCAAQ